PGLRHEHGRVGHPRRRALRDRLYEPGPGHGRELADAALLRVGRRAHGRPGDLAGHGAAAAGRRIAVAETVLTRVAGVESGTPAAPDARPLAQPHRRRRG